MTMGVRVSLGAHHLIPWDFEVYIRVLTSVALRGLEMVIIGEQIQSLTTELSLRVNRTSYTCCIKVYTKYKINLTLSSYIFCHREAKNNN